MDTRNQELKRLKKRCQRAKKKHIARWRAFGIFFLVLSLLFAPLCLAVKVFDNGLTARFGGDLWELENGDENALYFASEVSSLQDLAYQVQAEGAVLLKKENGALPLRSGGKISCFGSDELKTALEAVGLTVNTAPDGATDYADAAVVVYTGSEQELLQSLVALRKAGRLQAIILLQTEICEVDGADAALWIGNQPVMQAVADLLVGKVNPSGRLPQTVGARAGADQVVYPFGHGLSYTCFGYSEMAVEYSEQTEQFTVTVTVTNTGAVAGKETVQVYAQKENGGASLVGFGKTQLLQPGDKVQLAISVDKWDLAPHDGTKTCILEAGTYYLTVATDARSAANQILAAKGVETEENATLTYTWEQAEAATKTLPTTNKFTFTEVKTYDPADYPTVEMPTMGAENGLKLYDLMGISFDDPKWQTLLDQLTFADMAKLIGDTYGQREPVLSVGAPGAAQACAEELTVAAATFDAELLYAFGKAQGNGNLLAEEVIFQLTAANLSEDGFLAGKIRGAQLKGLEEKGILVLLKVADEDLLRTDEQAALKGYECAVAGFVTEEIVCNFGISGTTQSQGAEGVLAGVTAYGDWAPVGVWELYRYENDPVIVSAMRQACHRYLYALANSAGMNGIGENTTIKLCQPWFVLTCWIATGVLVCAFVFFSIMWHRGKKAWRKTDAYLNYRTLKNTLKEEKKS